MPRASVKNPGTALFLFAAMSAVCWTAGVPAPGEPAPPATAPAARVAFKPRRGAPADAVPGGARGASLPNWLATVRLRDWKGWVLSPEQAGLTARERPCLFYASTGSGGTLTLKLTAGGKTLLEAPVRDTPGVHRLDLAGGDVRLEPGVLYALEMYWSGHPGERCCLGLVRRIVPDAALATKLDVAGKLGPATLAIACAEEGLWWDALAALSGAAEGSPPDEALRAERRALLQQVKLAKAAEQDR